MKTFIKNGQRQDMKRTAEISPCGKFRWWLQRRWAEGPIVCFVMLNPSIADAEKDDPTIRRCIGFAQAWGFGALGVRNLYPYRATKPSDLRKAMKSMDTTGGQRGLEELACSITADLVIAAWGVNAAGVAVNRFIEATNPRAIWCLDTTLKGEPVHPLYQRACLEPRPFLRCKLADWKESLLSKDSVIV